MTAMEDNEDDVMVEQIRQLLERLVVPHLVAIKKQLEEHDNRAASAAPPQNLC